MSELTGELRRVADEAARQARPLPAADVIRRGDRRRRRAIVQRSLGGLSVAGIAAVVIFTGAASGAPAAPAASGAARSATTVTETTSSATGTMTIEIKYLNPRRGKITPLSVTYSGTSKAAVKRPAVVFVLGPAPAPWRHPANLGTTGQTAANRRPRIFAFVVSLRPNGLHEFSGSLPMRDIRAINRGGGLAGNDTALVTLASKISLTPHTVELRPLIQAGLVLTPRLG